jgi:hypothetical protein
MGPVVRQYTDVFDMKKLLVELVKSGREPQTRVSRRRKNVTVNL